MEIKISGDTGWLIIDNDKVDKRYINISIARQPSGTGAAEKDENAMYLPGVILDELLAVLKFLKEYETHFEKWDLSIKRTEND